ncbi:hypothetical protein EXS62_00920 [Candidatus Kaiserbacteria bacterium]|nr:hypothetical protein [Candidatus Kaiserbacteria bacterium]
MAEDSGISWSVDTHEHHDHSTDWYWGLGLIALAGAGLALFFGNALFAVIIAMSAGSIGVLAIRGPREHTVRLSERGVSLDGTVYRWDGIDSFWIEDGGEPRLLISTKGLLHPQLVIPLGDKTRAMSVRNYLRRHAAEEEQHAHLGEHLAEMFGL